MTKPKFGHYCVVQLEDVKGTIPKNPKQTLTFGRYVNPGSQHRYEHQKMLAQHLTKTDAELLINALNRKYGGKTYEDTIHCGLLNFLPPIEVKGKYEFAIIESIISSQPVFINYQNSKISNLEKLLQTEKKRKSNRK